MSNCVSMEERVLVQPPLLPRVQAVRRPPKFKTARPSCRIVLLLEEVLGKRRRRECIAYDFAAVEDPPTLAFDPPTGVARCVDRVGADVEAVPALVVVYDFAESTLNEERFACA